MARGFGAIRKLRSGNYHASCVAPDGARVKAPITFAKVDQAETWLAGALSRQRHVDQLRHPLAGPAHAA